MEDKEILLKQSHLQVETDLKALSKILDWFEEFNDGILQKQLASQCLLVLAESFISVVQHAHKNLPPKTPIDIELKLFEQYLEIQILEQGISFRSLAPLIAHLIETEEGSLGGEPVTPAIIDELCYIKLSNHRNGLVMRKRLN